jgi:hypothetical protein
MVPKSNIAQTVFWDQVVIFDLYIAQLRLSEFLYYKPFKLVDHTFTEFLHVDDVDMFVREFISTMTNVQILQCSYRFF